MTDDSVFSDQTAAYYTLGCKLNFAETSTIGRSLLEAGIRTARAGETAQVCVINTCSVTELANKKCRYAIRKAQREHPGAMIVVTGCYAQLAPEELIELEGVDLVVGAGDKLNLANLLRERSHLGKGARRVIASATESLTTFRLSRSSDERTRHFLKVQDGCDYGCSYCTIPKARGRSRSGRIADIVREAEAIVREGGLEIVLTGVNVGDFGRDTGERFVDLLRALDRVEGLMRYRIGSIEPNLLTEEIIDHAIASERCAPHFHLPLQSGSPEVLRLMRRRYTRDLFSSRIDYIHAHCPEAFVGIDVIAGSRGETAEHFEDCYRYLEELSYAQLHVFTYSERPGTSALSIEPVVDVRERHRRSARLQDLSARKLRAFYEKGVGRPHEVIWEEGNYDGWMYGHSASYLRIARPYDGTLVGTMSLYTPTELVEAEGISLR